MQKNHRVNFQELKARADFRVVLAHYGLEPVGQGEQVKIHCPFHADERPSCSVNLGKGLWQCFAGCGAGNVLDFVHRMETRDGAVVSLREAGLKLAAICSVPPTATATGGPGEAKMRAGGTPEAVAGAKTVPPTSPPRNAPITRQEARSATTDDETQLSSSQGGNGALRGAARATEALGDEGRPARNKPLGFRLTLNPEHPYLLERGLSPALVETFGLGFCDKGLMKGRVAIPIHNAEGELVAYAGRWAAAIDVLPEGKGKYELPAGFHKELELWNLHRVKHCRHLVVVEGFFDAIRLHSLRVPAVALMGTSMSDEQVELLAAHCPALRFLSVMLDGDSAGTRAADTVAARLSRHWWVRTITLPDDQEPDTLDPAELERLLSRRPREQP